MASGTRGVRLEIAAVGKVFGADTDAPFEALRPLTIDIAPGEFVSVVGPSGCGAHRALEQYSQRICAHFARLGVIHRDPVAP